MARFICPQCNQNFEMNWWKWMFTTAFHWFSFREWKDYRKTKCPHCNNKVFVKRV